MRAPAAIVIPVHGGRTFVELCLNAVLDHAPADAPIVVVDDASPDEDTERWLEQLDRREDRVELLRNAQNMGFSASVNRGLSRHPERDAVVLNSDTEVTPGWLQRLEEAAYARPEIGTATPLTNAGSIFTIPDLTQPAPLPEGWTADEMSRELLRVSPALRPEVPTAHGFCMFLKRGMLDDVGLLDAEAFPRGYGEENDLSCRARERGWTHVADDTCFVAHLGSGSFGAEKDGLRRAGRRVVDERFPYFSPSVRDWIAVDPLAETRRRMKRALSRPRRRTRHSLPRRILLVLHGGTGGVMHTTQDLVRGLGDDFDVWAFFSGRKKQVLRRLSERGPRSEHVFEPKLPPQLVDTRQAEYRRTFEEILDRVQPELLHVRHLHGHTHDPIFVGKERGLPVVLSVHDHYLVCPTITLIDNRGRYCRGYCNEDREDCELSPTWFSRRPRLKHGFLPIWRERVADFMQHVDAVITTSEDTRQLHLEHQPDSPPVHVIEHGRDFPADADVHPKFGRPLKIVALGGLNDHKGLALVESLAERFSREEAQFHVLGRTSRPVRGPVRVHGAYARDELWKRMSGLEPSIVLIPSIWAETYCHTLSEAWAMGLPVLGSHLGAVGERIRKHGAGWVIDPRDVDGVAALIRDLMGRPEEWLRRQNEARAMRFPTVEHMASAYARIYDELLPPRTRPLPEPHLAPLVRTLPPDWDEELPDLKRATKHLLYQVPAIRRLTPRLVKRLKRER